MFSIRLTGLGVIQNRYHFHGHNVRWMGGSKKPQYAFKNNAVYCSCDFDMRSLKINIFKVLFLDRGNKKQYCVYAFYNVDNSGRTINNLPPDPVCCGIVTTLHPPPSGNPRRTPPHTPGPGDSAQGVNMQHGKG